MLIALPLLAHLLATVVIAHRGGGQGDPGPSSGRRAFLLASIGWGALATLMAEGWGLVGLIHRSTFALSWLAVVVGLGVYAWRVEAFRVLAPLTDRLREAYDNEPKLLVVPLLGLVVLLGIVGLVSPANTVDSLLYHMSRVMHWAQNGSLAHYATGYHHQLMMPPWAEIAILHLRVLWGSDRLANLVQWFAMIGSLVGVSAIAAELGAGRRGQLLASVFAATVPLGVLQASSTQNDYVVAFWSVCAAFLVVSSARRSLGRGETLALGLALGLGLLTKLTFLVYGVCLGGAFVLLQVRRRGLRIASGSAMLVVLLVAGLNGPTWSRNLSTYGSPYGPADWIQTKLTTPALKEVVRWVSVWGAAAREAQPASDSGPPGLEVWLWPVPRIFQAAALNLVTPSGDINRLLWSLLDRFPGIFGEVVSGSLELAIWSHEDTAGNPLHLLLALASAPLAILHGRIRHRSGSLGWYALVVGMAILLFPLVIKRGSSGFGIRYHLPFFILWSPVFGTVVEALKRPRLASVSGGLLILSAVPYLLFNNTRPIVGAPPWPTRTESIFEASAVDLLFAANPAARRGYQEVTEALRASSCREVGLQLDSGDLEYQFWWLLEAPQSGFRMETIYTLPSLERYLRDDFIPCAVICTICSNESEVSGLALVVDGGSARLYGRPGGEWSP